MKVDDKSVSRVTVLPRSVDYRCQTIDNPNPLARVAHRARNKVALQIAARYLPSGGSILDIGAGTGDFLDRLRKMRPDVERFAFEPFMELRHPDIRQVTDLADVADHSVDVVSAFEVFEHLIEEVMENTIGQMIRVLKPEGHAVLSVPVMEGLALPLKEASRMMLFRRKSDYRIAELMSGIAGRSVARPDNLLTSHKGFSHRPMQRRLCREFRQVETLVTPVPALPWWLNSQFFGVFAAT